MIQEAAEASLERSPIPPTRSALQTSPRFPDFNFARSAGTDGARWACGRQNQACRGTKYTSAAYPAGVHAAGRKPVRRDLYREKTAKDR
jgi:hypothetical protein